MAFPSFQFSFSSTRKYKLGIFSLFISWYAVTILYTLYPININHKNIFWLYNLSWNHISASWKYFGLYWSYSTVEEATIIFISNYIVKQLQRCTWSVGNWCSNKIFLSSNWCEYHNCTVKKRCWRKESKE